MEIIEISNEHRALWNQFIVGNNGCFLHSWEWGEFQKYIGKKVWRFLIEDNGDILLAGLLIKHSLPLQKNYLYCPRGPVINQKYFQKLNNPNNNQKNLLLDTVNLFFQSVKNIGKQEKSIFLHWEPENLYFESSQLVSSPKQIQPHQTLILDLTQSEEELLSQMHPKTRYNIRLGERYGLELMRLPTIDGFSFFWSLLQKTVRRQEFRSYPAEYYQKMLTFLGGPIPENFSALKVDLFLARYQNQLIAANILAFFGEKVVYLHGASDYQYRKFMAPQWLQWQQIKEAKSLGYKKYDFWGIDEIRWPGITKFKKNFGGKIVNYPLAFDLILDKFWYKIYSLARKFL